MRFVPVLPPFARFWHFKFVPRRRLRRLFRRVYRFPQFLRILARKNRVKRFKPAVANVLAEHVQFWLFFILVRPHFIAEHGLALALFTHRLLLFALWLLILNETLREAKRIARRIWVALLRLVAALAHLRRLQKKQVWLYEVLSLALVLFPAAVVVKDVLQRL